MDGPSAYGRVPENQGYDYGQPGYQGKPYGQVPVNKVPSYGPFLYEDRRHLLPRHRLRLKNQPYG